jgi:hypothetical protein
MISAVRAGGLHLNKNPPRGGFFVARWAPKPCRYIRSIIALPKPEQETCVAPGMSRAKS